jgi:site-specific DNA-methyltransferase (adenine-specific)
MDFGNMSTVRFFKFRSTQFSLPTEQTYNKLIELYGINKMDGFKNYNEMGFENVTYTYNPQKLPGKPYKVKQKENRAPLYGNIKGDILDNKTGDRHPKSVIKCHQSDEKLHPTQKPSDLCEWLIKTYSNENDVVLDFCMGSGSSIIGCINSNRQYIGIEKDKTIFEVAQKRINDHKNIILDV